MEWTRREPPLSGHSVNEHTPSRFYAWLSSPVILMLSWRSFMTALMRLNCRYKRQGRFSRPLWHKLGLPEVKAKRRTKLHLALWFSAAELSNSPIAAAEIILKCYGCNIYLKIKIELDAKCFLWQDQIMQVCVFYWQWRDKFLSIAGP
jgi:hypothetical protein